MSVNSRADPERQMTPVSLAQRFARQQRDPTGYSYSELQDLSMREFGQLKINFGKVNKGRKFEDVVLSDPGWVKWCTEHLASSEKGEHRAFLLYVTRATEEVEALERHLLQPGEDSPIVIPVTPAPKARASGSSADPQVEGLRIELGALQQRVLHLESALEQLTAQVLHMHP
jgi:hypothetical protein